MSWVGVGVGAVTLISGIMGAKDEEKKQKEAIAKKKTSAVYKYSGTAEANDLMKLANETYTNSMVQEIARVGAENDRVLQGEIKKSRGKLVSQSEGITAGTSKGKQAIALEIQANKAKANSKSKTVAQINRIVEEKDKRSNDLNANTIKAHQEMSAALLYDDFNMSTASLVNTGVQSFGSGFSMGSQLGTTFKIGG